MSIRLSLGMKGLIALMAALAAVVQLARYFRGSSGDEVDSRAPDPAAKIRKLVDDGFSSKALKVYCDYHNVDFKAGQAAIEAIERELKGVPETPAAKSHAAVSVPNSGFAKPCGQQATDVPSDDEIMNYVSRNELIRAIKLHRTRYGSDLKTAKQAVEQMQKLHAQGGSAAAVPLPGAGSAAPLGADPEFQRCLAAGLKIQAIKRYRELTGLGLKEAKEAVDAIMNP